jgi:hypothetical protein
MWLDARRRQPSPTSSGRRLLRRGLSALTAVGAFLVWAARRGFFNTWPV